MSVGDSTAVEDWSLVAGTIIQPNILRFVVAVLRQP